MKLSKVKFILSFISKFTFAILRVYGAINLLLDYGLQTIFILNKEVYFVKNYYHPCVPYVTDT